MWFDQVACSSPVYWLTSSVDLSEVHMFQRAPRLWPDDPHMAKTDIITTHWARHAHDAAGAFLSVLNVCLREPFDVPQVVSV